jgi:hypothetical protein
MPISRKMVARLVARLPAVAAGKTYEDDPHSFRSLRKSDTIAAREPELPDDAAHKTLLIYMYEALVLEQKQLLLALESEPGDLKKEPEPTATLPAPGGAANGLIGVARLAKARQQGDGNPSCLVSSKATIATSLSTSNAVPSAADVRRHGAARGAARGGKPGVSRFVAQGRGDQHRQGGTLAGKAAGKPFVSIFVGVARQGHRLALTGRRLATPPTRHVPVHELAGRGDR